MFSSRTTCVLCTSQNLDFFYSLENYPLLCSPTQEPESNDILCTLDFKICNSCKCVQLTSLVDPGVLYSDDNKSALTPLWLDHHTQFADFVCQHLESSSICEIGGGSNPLVSFFPSLQSYSVLDLYEPSTKLPGIRYLKGNCESFTDYSESAILLSHTFEHLYNPRMFLECLAKSNVQSVFLSVPNMNLWLKEKMSSFLLFTQHTFYFEKEDVLALFSQYGFRCQAVSEFQHHSLFFSFQRSPPLPLPIPIKTVSNELFTHFHQKHLASSAILTEKPFFIMPSYYIGQIAYQFLNRKDMVLGFLDNDPNKISKRMYGTNLKVYAPSEITKYSSDQISVVLVMTPYFQEMQQQLKTLSPLLSIQTLSL